MEGGRVDGTVGKHVVEKGLVCKALCVENGGVIDVGECSGADAVR